ncbi:unnamed protein product [Lymnaea stagnalis]|uniref:Carboxylic ester hydrolase n=1 Tax=Lymnaea stagnalis TaxID=6523 RepID=A0AAV2I7D5_LYMST
MMKMMMIMMMMTLSLIILGCVLSRVPYVQAASVMVETTLGTIRGTSNGLTVAFRGVPYALPPVGKLRWQPPQPPAQWRSHILEATEDPPGCPQIGCEKLTPAIACPQKTSEDCLYLNIFTPSGAKNGSDLPVMVYIHGGNFFDMSGASPLFDGMIFSQRGNVVHVNMNYRLGALGFLVTGDGVDDARGNYGLYDQILALKWVRDNIRQFGGDPDKITLFGQSAGAQSVIQHMTLEETSGLFRQAIIESSPLALPYKTYTEAFVLGGLLAEAVGCPVRDIDCLRNKSAEEVTKASLTTRSEVASLKFLELFEPYGPYIDGQMVKGQPLDVYRKGQFTKKPIIIGTTREETVLYIYGSYNKSIDLVNFMTLLLLVRPDKMVEIIEHYPPRASSEDQREVLVNISTDLVFGCPTRNLTRTLLGQGEADIWMYLWDHAFSFPGWGNVTFCEDRVCHGTEIVYEFHTAYKGNFTMTPEEEVLSTDLITYWTNFAWTGDPNQKGDQHRRRGCTLQGVSLMKTRDSSDKAIRISSAKTDESERVHVTNDALTVEDEIHLAGKPLSPCLESSQKNGDTPIAWPKYSGNSQWSALHFQVPQNQIVQNYKEKYCDFWDVIGYSSKL